MRSVGPSKAGATWQKRLLELRQRSWQVHGRRTRCILMEALKHAHHRRLPHVGVRISQAGVDRPELRGTWCTHARGGASSQGSAQKEPAACVPASTPAPGKNQQQRVARVVPSSPLYRRGAHMARTNRCDCSTLQPPHGS